MAPSPGTVLVTGGTGFIGGWCIADLVANGYTVRATVRDLTRSGQVTEAISRTVDRKSAIEFVTADLNADDGWDQAMAGVRAVMHVASPMGIIGGGSAESLVSTTLGGVERVFAAAGAAGVERIVMTSAANASSPSSYASGGVTDETLWTDPNDPTLIPYRRAKTLAEQLAWDLAGKPGSPELVTILPGAVFGPVLSASTVGSVGIIGRMLEGKMRRLPRIGFEIVDVRDLARLQSLALVEPRAAGERFLGTATSYGCATWPMSFDASSVWPPDASRPAVSPTSWCGLQPGGTQPFARSHPPSVADIGTPPPKLTICSDGSHGPPRRQSSTAPRA